MSSLFEFFARIAPSLDTDAETLMAYAQEDTETGWEPYAVSHKWTSGSVFGIEGQALYAIVRALKPRRAIEYGALHGCSATHILLALEANGDGELVSLDESGYAGQPMAEALGKRWTFVGEDAVPYMEANRKHFDFVFEDTSHSQIEIEALLRSSAKAKPKLVMSHDALHHLVGEAVRGAWNSVYGETGYDTIMLDGSDCGFAWKFTGEV